jgi:hypothetical protein
MISRAFANLNQNEELYTHIASHAPTTFLRALGVQCCHETREACTTTSLLRRSRCKMVEYAQVLKYPQQDVVQH